MPNPINSTINLYDAQLQAAKDLIDAALSSAQRIDRALLQTAKEELNSQLTYAQAWTVARDPRGAAVLRDSFEHPNRERTLACYREIFDAMSEAVLTSTRVFDRYVQDLGRSAADTVRSPETAGNEKAALLPPAGVAEMWNAGWRQWNDFAEHWRKAMTAAVESREPPDDDNEPLIAETAGKQQPERSRRH